MKLLELTKLVGLAPRQVRYLISEGFIPPPTGGRAHASYGHEHVEAIERYKRLKELGFTPAAIRRLLDTKVGAPFPVVRGVTLVVSPDLIASGADSQPILEALAELLPGILAQTTKARSGPKKPP